MPAQQQPLWAGSYAPGVPLHLDYGDTTVLDLWEDAARRQEIEIRNEADALVYTTERTLQEHGGQISPADRSAVERALDDARAALKGSDLGAIKRAKDSLTQAAQKLAEAIARSSQRRPGGETGPSETTGGFKDSDVVEGELVDDK